IFRASCYRPMPSVRNSRIAVSTPADRVGRKRQRERHPVRLAERLSVAQDAVVARRRLDREAGGFEPAEGVAHVLRPSVSWRFGVDGIRRKTACRESSAATASSGEFRVASKYERVTRISAMYLRSTGMASAAPTSSTL